jgi:hypothetical protein
MSLVDERFRQYRQRSTSIGGIAGVIVATGLFEYRYFVNHFWSWDLLSVAITIVGVKVSVMAWHYLKR